MKKLLIKFFFLIALSPRIVVAEHTFSRNIDFSEFKSSLDHPDVESDAWYLGYAAFNFAPELTPYFAFLKQKYQIDTAIETGIYHGSTTVCLSYLFDKVHTIDLSEDIYNYARDKLKEHTNVQCHFGSSELVLSEILPLLIGKPVFFYLDAHWGPYWPLLDEIAEIGKTHRDNCIIVIDDFKVPGRNDIPYDLYGSHDCSFEYVRNQLDKVFTDYDYYYLIPRSVRSKAKFIAIPKQWVTHSLFIDYPNNQEGFNVL